jgi:hypothetical protein
MLLEEEERSPKARESREYEETDDLFTERGLRPES